MGFTTRIVDLDGLFIFPAELLGFFGKVCWIFGGVILVPMSGTCLFLNWSC